MTRKYRTLNCARSSILLNANASGIRAGEATATMRTDVAAVAQDRRRNWDIEGESMWASEDDFVNVNESAACILSCSMEPQQSSRIDINREDDNLNDGLAVGELESERNNDETCTQN